MASGMEIERKFLVHKSVDWKSLSHACSHIQQGYMKAAHTVRIRLRDQQGFLTIKGPSADGGLSRYEFEKEITKDEALSLLRLCQPGMIDKHRYLVAHGGHVFEVDEFHGDNEGLVIAEVELASPNEPFEKPGFLGPEVTGDHRFYNSHLRRNPFSLWRATLPAEYR